MTASLQTDGEKELQSRSHLALMKETCSECEGLLLLEAGAVKIDILWDDPGIWHPSGAMRIITTQ